ncbi:hypothetical protein AOQ84DRAFT_100766 [Glonium stellatum]|uniref:Uncharacterized protein n=1 Tax=Glonium stellatum TaxID=574774 RepID=A0A8E2EUT6_9PEZI|nr:hypothetical protein AOQ84DRAFT_100766 [Glonium stellatum]
MSDQIISAVKVWLRETTIDIKKKETTYRPSTSPLSTSTPFIVPSSFFFWFRTDASYPRGVATQQRQRQDARKTQLSNSARQSGKTDPAVVVAADPAPAPAAVVVVVAVVAVVAVVVNSTSNSPAARVTATTTTALTAATKQAPSQPKLHLFINQAKGRKNAQTTHPHLAVVHRPAPSRQKPRCLLST